MVQHGTSLALYRYSVAGLYDRSMTEQSARILVIIASSSPHRTVIGPSRCGHGRSLRWGWVAERRDSGEPVGHHRAQEEGVRPGRETESTFWIYLALIAGCLLGAVLLLRAHARLSWAAAMVLSISPFIGYLLSRTTGLPGAMGDIGNWTEPLGLYGLAGLRRRR
jgi:hypothetical protein